MAFQEGASEHGASLQLQAMKSAAATSNSSDELIETIQLKVTHIM